MLPNIDKGVVIQQFIEGRDEMLFSFHGYFNVRCEPVACFIGRKIRTNPIHFGGSAFIETVHRPDFMQFCLNLCRHIGFVGVVKIDCKLDASTGQYTILEFNPRFNLWEYLGASAGVNIPRAWYDDLAGNPCRTSLTCEAGCRWLNLAADLCALPAYVRSGEWTFWQWIRSHRGPTVFHTFEWKDPMPFLISFPRFLRRRVTRFKLRTYEEGKRRLVFGALRILRRPYTQRI